MDVKVRASKSYPAHTFWREFFAMLPYVAEEFLHNRVVTLSESRWEEVKRIPGFLGGPFYREDALVREI